MKKYIITGFFVFASCSSVLADESNTLNQYQTPTRSHFYVGERLGWSRSADLCISRSDCEKDTVGYSLFAGYQFNNNFSLEAGISNYGSPDFERQINSSSSYTSNSDIWGAELAGKFTVFEFDDRFDIYAKVGAAYQFMSPNSIDNNVLYDRWGMLTAIGIQYDISNQWSFRMEYQYTDFIGNQDQFDDASMQFTSVGLIYRFGQNKVITNTVVQEKQVEKIVEKVIEKQPPKRILISKKETFNNFSYNHVQINGPEKLNGIVNALKTSEGIITIKGYTDSRGTRVYNQNLSYKRALSVADILVSKGVDRNKIQVTGMGEDNPIATNMYKEGRDKNRRVEIDYSVNEVTNSIEE